MDKEQTNKYEESIVDVDEVQGTDIKINPDFYIHTAILKAQEALTKDQLKDGFVQYRVMVEHIESLCRAANMLSQDYEEKISLFKQSADYKEERDEYLKSVKIATKKLEFLMAEVFSHKVSIEPLKM